MGRIIKTISLQPQMAEEIDNMKSFNFSEWIQQKWGQEFRGIDSKKEKLEKLRLEAKKLEQIIEIEKQKNGYLVFCPLCGEPTSQIKKVNKSFFVCTFCIKNRFEDAVEKAKELYK